MQLPISGQIVKVRERQYLVEHVAPFEEGAYTPVMLACLADDAQGERLEVLWEAELDRQILEVSWDALAHPDRRDAAGIHRPFDPPRQFAAYLSALRWNLVSATDPTLVQAPFRAGIEILAYQLEPLRKALLLPRVNLFIADDVGLGKTIEAALIIRELMMRQRVRRIVIGAPANVVYQWKTELEERFGLGFQILDRDYVQKIRAERGHAANPWKTHTRFIVSHALLRDPRYNAPLRLWLDPKNESATALQTLLVLDEAHNAAPASDGAYAVDSNFTKAIRGLAPLFEHRLFLSATPHNGLSNSFSALLEILDPLRFVRGTSIDDPKRLEPVMVRRLKRDLKGEVDGMPERQVVAVTLTGTPDTAPELALWSALDTYCQGRRARLAKLPAKRKSAELLALVGLQKFLLSSIAAFVRPLEKHLAALASLPPDAEPPHSDDSDDATDPIEPDADADDDGTDEDLDAQREAAETARTRARVPATANELQQLRAMLASAHAHAREPDARIHWLAAFIRERLCPDFPVRAADVRTATLWNRRRLVIFSEYTTTLDYVCERLGELIPDVEARVATLTGSVSGKDRQALSRRFSADPEREPLRILVATDAAREGINLQSHASDLIHFDLPWNPARLEQRNGRIDRRLQPEKVVTCRYFRYDARPVDRVLAELMERTQVIARELGHIPPVIAARFQSALTNALADRANVPTPAPDTLAKLAGDLASERALTPKELADLAELGQDQDTPKDTLGKQLTRLRAMIDRSERHLDFARGELRQALEVALQLLGKPPLSPVETPEGDPQLFALPPLSDADRSWSATLDALRPPKREDEDWPTWRRHPLRPIRFEPKTIIDETTVHLHLEHKVVQRLLNRFLAQGFAARELSRVCLSHTSGRIPRVALIGRLSLFGDGGARLHDELVIVAATWTDTTDPHAPLQLFKDQGTESTWKDLKAALADGKEDVPEGRKRIILDALPQHMKQLQAELTQRFATTRQDAVSRLDERASSESTDLQRIILEQLTKLTAELDRPIQLLLSGKGSGLNEDERRQRELDIKAWQARTISLRRDLKTEPAKVRESYEVRAERMEPVGIVYLWPRGG